MDLETVIQSEVCQKEKSKDRKLTHIRGTQKNGTDEPVFKAKIDTEVENKRMDTRGKGGGGGRMNWEAGIDIYTLIGIKQITNKNLLYKKNKIQKTPTKPTTH